MYDTYGFEGPKATSYTHYNFDQANDIFANFFSSNPFEHDDDDFFGNFFKNRGTGHRTKLGSFGSFGGFPSMFDNDDFFKNGFGSSIKTSTSTGMGGVSGGTSMSTSTVTKTVYFCIDIATARRWCRRRR